jgi:hypothetical protein
MGRDREGSDEVAVGIEWEAVLVQSVSGIFGYAGQGLRLSSYLIRECKGILGTLSSTGLSCGGKFGRQDQENETEDK